MDYLKKNLKNAGLLVLVLLLLCGILYPLLMTGAAKLIFPKQADGSLIEADGKLVGSALIGQSFEAPYYLQARPSAVGYNVYTEADKAEGRYTGVASGSANYAATNPELLARIEADLADFLEKNPTVKAEDIPADLLTASGSGLDPHISPQAATIQLDRIVEASGLDRAKVEAIVDAHTQHKVLGIFGEDRVNVLETNLDIAQAMGLLPGESK